jgi:hypothetical protein
MLRPPPSPQPTRRSMRRSPGVGQLERRGQAFLTTEAGNVKVAAGRLVTLDPATTYARA